MKNVNIKFKCCIRNFTGKFEKFHNNVQKI